MIHSRLTTHGIHTPSTFSFPDGQRLIVVNIQGIHRAQTSRCFRPQSCIHTSESQWLRDSFSVSERASPHQMRIKSHWFFKQLHEWSRCECYLVVSVNTATRGATMNSVTTTTLCQRHRTPSFAPPLSCADQKAHLLAVLRPGRQCGNQEEASATQKSSRTKANVYCNVMLYMQMFVPFYRNIFPL